ncbi:Rsd/AlgQ family anti-sigma factor [Candidatus Methylocalor cossyra]|uniref:Anti-RNa polymerase sigma 70 factor n=1 Tax=Candidatus Methylocalor cossyra TaxID=3108543 RepID=A0ABM9NI47_9GAMM
MIENLAERRQNTTKIVRELLEERRQVWALYCDIGGIQPFTARQPLEGKLQEFRQLLIDYISLGHFGLYQRITDGTERRRKVLEVAEQIYPRIAAATDVAVAFNDKYEMLASVASLAELSDDLSRLGEALAVRGELEDQLLSAMVSRP